MAAGKPSPFLIPAGVVHKIKDVIRYAFAIMPERKFTEPVFATGTLEIDPVSGKILDIHLTTDWTQTADGYTPKYGVVWITSADNGRVMFGRVPCPDPTKPVGLVIHTTEP